MQQVLQLLPDPQLKGLQIIIKEIRGYQQGDCIKISQANNHIYTIYRPSPHYQQSSIKIGNKLIQANQLKKGVCKIQRVPVLPTKKVKVKVSKLDWQIVNSRAYKLQQQFLNQITLIWPNAKIPLFYTRNDSVMLTCICDDVFVLQQYSDVQFDCQDEDIGQINKREIQQLIYTYLQEIQEKSFGYENTIIISQNLFNEMNLDYKQIYHIQNSSPIPLQNLNTIKNYIKYEKQMQTTPNQPLKPRPSKLVQVRIISSKIFKKYQYSCSDICKKFCGLEDRIKLSNQKCILNSVGLQVLLKQQKKYFEVQLITDEELSQERFKNKLSKQIVNQIITNQYMYVLHNHFMIFQHQLILLKVFKDQPNQRNQNIKLINTNNNLSNNDILDIQATLQQKIKIKQSTIQGYPLHSIQMLNFIKQDKETPKLVYKSFITIYRKQIDKIKSFLDQSLQTTILITSNSNNGKTLLSKVLKQTGYSCWSIDLQNLNDPSLSIEQVSGYLQVFIQLCPYKIIYMDNIDNLCYKVDDGDVHRQHQKIVSKIILRKILKLVKIYKKSVIFTAKSADNIDEELYQYQNISLKNPSKQERENVIQHNAKMFQNKPFEIQQSISFGSLMKFITTGIYTSKKSADLTKFNFSKLAGLKDAKQFLRRTIEKPLKYSSLYKKLPIKMPRGILLYGPTGTGKTALGNALKDELGVKYFSVKGSDILSKYIGGSEAAVRQIFERAMAVSPSIIFFDQFQSIAPKRNAASTGVNDRVVNQFLCYLDGVSSTQGVFIVAASSRPDLIDPALLRPGRLDIHLFLDYPTKEQRSQLLRLYSNSVRIQIEEEYFIRATQGFNYSDLIGLLKQLRIKKSSLVLKTPDYHLEQFKTISKEFFDETVKSFKISVSPQDQSKQRKIYQQFRSKQPPQIKQQKTMLM